MFNLIQLQDRLRGFSEDQLKQFLRTPDPSIPDFMVMAALDEKNDAKMQEAQMKSQQPSVREEMLAVAGLPAMEAGQMASSMAPKSDVRTNTGGDDMMTMARLAEDMPMEDDMEEDEELDIVETPIRRMSGGGLAGTNETTEMPGLTPENELKSLYNRMQQRYLPQRSSGLQGLGMDIRRQVAGRTDGEVNEFITDVENMAEERFDVNLGQSTMPTPFGGKGVGTRMPRPMVETQPLRPSVSYTGVRPGVRPGASAFGSVMRRATEMNEGGIASMQGGGRGMFTDPNFNPSMNLFPMRVRPRPADAQGQGLLGSMGFDPNKFQRTDWDAQFGKYYNADGTIKDEYKDFAGVPKIDTAVSPKGSDPLLDAQEEFEKIDEPKPTEKKDEKDDPDPDGTGGGNYLSDLTASLDKMREDQKEQMEKNQALGIMLEGLKLARRGVIDDETGKGLQFMGQQQAKVQDRLAQLQGLEAKIGIAGATLAQKDRATKAALEKALKKSSSMTTSQLASEIKGYSSEIGKLRKQLGEETIAFDDQRVAETEDEIKRLAELRSLYVADLKSRYGGDILDNDFLKTLLDETQEDK